jgi:2-polyprenyl-6-methoxyphenol hydroxylase-like FAD-dependent oxidoreductase
MAEDFGAVTMSHLAEYDEKGNETRRVDLTEQNKMWQHPWMLVHRVRLHDKLKQIATEDMGKGRPAKLYLCSKVVAVDSENATITLELGDKIKADLVLAADGIYVSVSNANGPSLNIRTVKDERIGYWPSQQALWVWKGSVQIPYSTQKCDHRF